MRNIQKPRQNKSMNIFRLNRLNILQHRTGRFNLTDSPLHSHNIIQSDVVLMMITFCFLSPEHRVEDRFRWDVQSCLQSFEEEGYKREVARVSSCQIGVRLAISNHKVVI